MLNRFLFKCLYLPPQDFPNLEHFGQDVSYLVKMLLLAESHFVKCLLKGFGLPHKFTAAD